MRSSSSIATVSILSKFKEAATFLSWRFSKNTDPDPYKAMFRLIDEYRITYEQLTGKPFSSARIFEIGYGQRPFSLFALTSMGMDASGIDLDMPMIGFSFSRLFAIAKRNGLERALKTGVRSALFDRSDRGDLDKSLRLRGYKLRIDRSRLLVGNAAVHIVNNGPIDVVYSEDVFEHIPLKQLELLMQNLAAQLSPDGLALIRPNIFTGITGGHIPEWYSNQVDQIIPRSTEPWEHLRKRRFPANTYLNELTRTDYRTLFSAHFEILDEKVFAPDLGRQWLTPEVRNELAAWSEEELFSNKVLFVLRHKQ
jgi:hypothetical protein